MASNKMNLFQSTEVFLLNRCESITPRQQLNFDRKSSFFFLENATNSFEIEGKDFHPLKMNESTNEYIQLCANVKVFRNASDDVFIFLDSTHLKLERTLFRCFCCCCWSFLAWNHWFWWRLWFVSSFGFFRRSLHAIVFLVVNIYVCVLNFMKHSINIHRIHLGHLFGCVNVCKSTFFCTSWTVTIWPIE